MSRIRGVTVVLHEQRPTGAVDELGFPVYELRECEVENVLIAPVMGTEATETVNLTGRRAVYQLGIPKGDTHRWEEGLVEFFGEHWRVIGPVTQGIEELIPLDWNQKVVVERYG
jgi:hypothetical protein